MPLNFMQKLLIFQKIDSDVAHLIEPEPNAFLRSIRIKNLPNDSALLKCDKMKINNVFKDCSRGQNKRCDYILISNNTVYFIELKSAEESETKYFDDCIKKFKGVLCITDYIDSVMVNFYKKDKFFSPLQKKYILLFLSPSINKKPTSLRSCHENRPIHNEPDKFLPLPVKNESTIDISLLY